MVASDRISTYDVVHPTEIPDKGKVLTGLSVLWFDLTRDIVPNHLLSATDGVPASCAAGRCASSGWRCCRSSASCAATSPARAGRTTRRPARSRASSCPPGCRSPSSCRSRSSRRRRRRRRATTRRSTSTQAAELVGSRELAERLRDVSIAVYEAVAAHARERGVILADTKFEFGFDGDGDADAGRRGLHAGLLALLAGRPVRGRPRAAVVRQAVRARLGVGHRLGQVAAGAADPRRRRRRHARALRDGVREARRASRSRAWLERVA